MPDGATLSSNLFSITPASSAPPFRFFSLSLERPGSDTIPSLLGIGRHPTEVVSDPSKIEYGPILSASSRGPIWWQGRVEGITLFVDGVKKTIPLPTSVENFSGGTPSAILDSGVPVILTTQEIANGIYGALGIGPAADGNCKCPLLFNSSAAYAWLAVYISCTTPINMTIQLDNRTSIPLHPLDMSYYPPNDATSDDCIGVIQTTSQTPNFQLTEADMILGVPFLRNTYTVLAYDQPFDNGTFPPNGDNADRPRLGLLGLTDPATAAEEFNQVRVLRQPLGTVAHTPIGSSSKGLSVGIEVLIGLLGFFGLCFVLFGARWAFMKRKYARERAQAAFADGKDGYALGAVGAAGYGPARRKSRSEGSGDDGEPSEDELRRRRYEAYRRTNMTDDTALTRVESGGSAVAGKKVDEFGALMRDHPDTPGTPMKHAFFDPWDDTLIDDAARRDSQLMLSPLPKAARRESSYSTRSHTRTLSGGPSPEAPLLAHGRSLSNSSAGQRGSADIAEFALDSPRSMVGIGTARGRDRFDSLSVPRSPLPTPGAEDPPPLTPRSPLRQVHQAEATSPQTLTPSAPLPLNDSRVSDVGHERMS